MACRWLLERAHGSIPDGLIFERLGGRASHTHQLPRSTTSGLQPALDVPADGWSAVSYVIARVAGRTFDARLVYRSDLPIQLGNENCTPAAGRWGAGT